MPALRELEDLPGPRGLPILGSALSIDVEHFHSILERWADEYGPAFHVKLGPTRALVLTDHTLTREICRSRPEGFRRPRAVKRVFEEAGADGVFSAEGTAWRRQRKLMMAALSPASIGEMFEPVCRSVRRLDRLWRAAADEQRAIEAHADLRRFAVDVASTVAFGIDVNTLEKGSSELRRHLEPIFPVINRRVNAIVPYWRYLRLPSDRAFDRALAVLRGRVGELIADARARLAAEPSRAKSPADLIEAMLVARDEDDEALRVSDDEIFANALTVLIAGEDTTSNTAAWMFDHLARAPEIQGRLREEIRNEWGDASLPTDPRALRKLPFLNAVAHETLRLRSAAPVMFFEGNSEQVVGDIRVKERDLIIVLTRKAATLDANFADGLRFDPARWLNDERPADAAHDATAALAFGYGPRICPGRSLALMELSLLGAALTTAFEFTPTEDSPPTERFAFTMGPSAVGLNVKRSAGG